MSPTQLPTNPPTEGPTAAPTSAPTSAPTRSECSFLPAMCGDSLAGSLGTAKDNDENGLPDQNILLTVDVNSVLTVKLCDPKIKANIALELWSGCRADSSSEKMAVSRNDTGITSRVTFHEMKFFCE